MKTGFLCRVMGLLACGLLLAACASPRMSGELASGKMAFQEGNYPKAFHELLPVAKSGRPEAQYAVGYMYYYGYGVQRDTSAGIFWIERAAAQHYALASQALDRIHRDADEEAPSSAPRTAGLKEAVSPSAAYTATPLTPSPVHHKRKQAKPSATKPAAHVTTGQACAAPAKYVLQLYGSWQLASAKQFSRQRGFDSSVSVCRTLRDGKDWFVLVTGKFKTNAEAQKAKAGLPHGMKVLHPWVRITTGLYSAG